MMGLLFHYEDPFVDVSAGVSEPLPRATITGQRTRPIDVRALGKTGILLVTFHPWGASAFLPGSMMDLADRATDLADVLDRGEVRRLAERMHEAKSPLERVALVETFLLREMDDARRDGVAVASTLRLRDPRQETRPLASEHQLSVRQWIRRFESSVGLRPKSFARVLRFQRATALKRSGRDWGEVCLACGYYDQAHLIKEFQEFAGCSFDAFSPRSTPLMRTFNRSGPVSLFYNTVYL
jgi:AraC-like DNA-binding protein